MKRDKIKKLILIVLCLIVLLCVFFLGYFYAWYTDSKVYFNNYVYDYYRKEHYYASNKFLSFSKEYYHEDSGKSVIEKRKFKSVEDNVEKINKYIENFFDNLYEADKNINVEFAYDLITSDDYYDMFFYENNISLNYYDVSENVLYIFEFPNEDKEMKE